MKKICKVWVKSAFAHLIDTPFSYCNLRICMKMKASFKMGMGGS